MDSGFGMALLFLAPVPSRQANREETRLQLQLHAIIYVMKTFFTFFFFTTERFKKNSEEKRSVFTPIKCKVMHVGMRNGQRPEAVRGRHESRVL